MHFLPQYLILHWVIHDRYDRKDSRQQGMVVKREVIRNSTNLFMQEVKLILMWTTDGIYTLPGMSDNFQPKHLSACTTLQLHDSLISQYDYTYQ